MARGRKSSLVVALTEPQRLELEAVLRRTTAPAGVVRRARMVLFRAEGHALLEVARRVGVDPNVVYKWIRRYLQRGLRGLGDKPRAGFHPGALLMDEPGGAMVLDSPAQAVPDRGLPDEG